MHSVSYKRSFQGFILCVGILSLFTSNLFAQSLPEIRNQVQVDYKDILQGTYSTKSNIVITSVIGTTAIDLWVIKQGPQEIIPGGIATYTITYGNKGTAIAYGVTFCDQFPVQMKEIIYNGAGYPLIFDSLTKRGTWNVGILPPGTYSFQVSLRIKEDTLGSSSITNYINSQSPVPELYWQNNYSSWTTKVELLDIDLWVTKKAPAMVPRGGIATYTITYGNSGGTVAMNVKLVDQFPEQIQTIIHQDSGLAFEYDTLTKCGTWSIDSLLPGTYSFNLAIKIKDETRGTIINRLKIKCPVIETNQTNNQSTAITHITDVDMEIFNYGNAVILSGQNLTYTIYYRNRGSNEAENVTITDYLPGGVRYVSDTSGCTPTITGSGTISQPQIIRWNIGTVSPSYNYHQFQITAFISGEIPASPTLSAQINNVVEVTTTSPESNHSNNRATCTTTVNAGRADVYIYKYVKSNVISGQEIIYGIYCGNSGNVPAGSVTINDYLPEGLEYRSAVGISTPTISASSTSGGQVLTWQLGTMSLWENKQFQITALITNQVPASRTIHNVVEITTPTQEENYTNNRATATSHVEEPKIDLWVRKYGPSKINPGYNTIEYSIMYGNRGNIEVGSVTIIDILPLPATGSVLYATDTSGLAGTQTGNQITWFVGTLTPAAYKYFTMRIIVDDIPGSTTLTNNINIYPMDNNSFNNHYVTNTHVEHPKIDLEIIKRGPYQILAGEKIVYTIQYRNRGSVDAGSTTITDILPVGVTYATDTSGFTPTIIKGTPTQLIWELGTRAMTGAGNWVIFQMTGTLSANVSAPSTLTNRVEISTRDMEVNYNNNTFTFTTHIIPAKADIRITKYNLSPDKVIPGGEIKYWLTYSNYGNVSATNTVIIDTLPGSVTFVSCSGNGTLSEDGKEVRWNIGTLTKEGYGGVYLTVRANDDVEGTLTNIVDITSNTPDLDYSNQHATCSLQVSDCYADVSISKYGPYSIQAGKTMRYHIRYGNYYGNIAATNTLIIDLLPAGVTYATDTSGLPLTRDGGTLTWQVGTLAPGYSGYFYLDVNVNQDLKGSTTITNKIEIKTNTYEKDKTNNQSSWMTHILPDDVDIGITKYGPLEAAQGQKFEYRIKVHNYSEVPAEDVYISDILPSELQYISSNRTPIGTGSHIIWKIGTLSRWSSEYLTLQVKVKDDVSASSTITNVVEVTTTNPETNYSNNRATVSTHICLPEPKLRVRKWQSYGEVTTGQKMEYYIRYTNEGKGAAGSVTLTDILPAGVSYVSDNSGIKPNLVDNKVIWDIGMIPPNKTADFKLQVSLDKYIPASTTLSNLIEITTSYPYLSSDRYTCTTHVKKPVTDVLIYKFGPDEVLYGTSFTYEITYNNNSIFDADGVVITDILDPRLVYVSDTCGPSPSFSGNRISWDIGTMTPWAGGHFLLKVFVPSAVPASATLTNVVEITTLTDENNYNNNRATVTTHVGTPKVDVGIEKKGDDARPGFRKKYHITYYNKGTEQAEDVWIIDKLPSQVQYLSSSGGDYNSASHTVTWNIDSLPPQTKKYLTIEVKIPPTQPCGINLYNYIEIITASLESDYTNNKFTEIETVVTSIDPNDKLVSPQKYIRDNEVLNYTIRFENQATATASAILITIEDQLPSNLDWETMKFDQIKIGTRSYTLEDFDRGSLTCSYDVGSGIIRWVFDFETGEQGLPPNVIPPEGEGYVSFSIKAKAGLPSGTEISNTATIRFDYNEPMDTPAVINIVDLDKPTSKVLPLAPYQTATSFAVYWSGTDTTGSKSGEVENYTIYVSDNNGEWTKWLEETVETSGTFTGQTGHTYTFYCLAKDRAKNTEEKTPTKEAWTSLTIPKHFVIATLTTKEMCVGETLFLTISIYDSEGNLVTDYVGSATLSDKLGLLGDAVFNGTHTWTGEVTIPQIPNGGTNNISVEAEGVIGTVSDTFLMLLDYQQGGTVTFFTPNMGTTTVRFGSSTLFGGLSQNFYVIIDYGLPPVVPEGGVSNSAREIRIYNRVHNLLSGTLSTLAYLEIPYLDTNQDGFVDGTSIKERTLRVYVWRDNQWQEIVDSGVDEVRNIVWCQIAHLSNFMPIGILVAPSSTLGNVVVYPNPFKPNSGLGHEYITFGSKRELNRRLTDYATIKIYTIAGELVKTLEVTPQDNGQKRWNADNDSGQKVASGIYIYLITNPQGEKCIGKLAIIR